MDVARPTAGVAYNHPTGRWLVAGQEREAALDVRLVELGERQLALLEHAWSGASPEILAE